MRGFFRSDDGGRRWKRINDDEHQYAWTGETITGGPVSAWSLAWTFPAGQSIAQIWNATHVQSGSQVTATNVYYDGSVDTGP